MFNPVGPLVILGRLQGMLVRWLARRVESTVMFVMLSQQCPATGSIVDLGAGTRANLDLPALSPASPDSVFRVARAPIVFSTL